MSSNPVETFAGGIEHDALDMHTRIQPGLRIKRCFSDSFSVWTHHLPLLIVASLLTVIISAVSATFLMGSMYAGFLVILLKGMRGDKPTLRDLFSEVRHCFRFFAITLFILLLTAIGFALLLAPFFILVGNWRGRSGRQIRITRLIEEIGTSMDITTLLSILAVVAVVGFVLLMIPGIMFGVRCFYMYLLAADRNVQMDEAFVESRKAVQRYGFRKHLYLIVLAFVILFGSGSLAEVLFSDPSLTLENVVSMLGMTLQIIMYSTEARLEASCSCWFSHSLLGYLFLHIDRPWKRKPVGWSFTGKYLLKCEMSFKPHTTCRWDCFLRKVPGSKVIP